MGMPSIMTPGPTDYVNLTAAGTYTYFIGQGACFNGVSVSQGSTGGAVTVYDNNAASGTVLIYAAGTTTSNTLIAPFGGDGVMCKSGYITIVATGSPFGQLNVLYEPSIP